MEFSLVLSPDAIETLTQLERDDLNKANKVKKTLGQMQIALLETRGLNVHKVGTLDDGRDIWTAYVENNTPGAWRIFWAYSNERASLDILRITKHPEY